MPPENPRPGRIIGRRYVTDSAPEQARSDEPRYRIYRLCECDNCKGKGRYYGTGVRCEVCRGEGRVRERVAECETPEALGLALVTLGREGEFTECPVGILDTQGETGQKWLVSPWLPSARNVSDAGRTLAKSKQGKGNT